MYVINGTVSTVIDGWTRTQSIPTFYLNKNVQGIVNKTHAEAIAHTIVNPLRLSNLTVNLSAFEVNSI